MKEIVPFCAFFEIFIVILNIDSYTTNSYKTAGSRKDRLPQLFFAAADTISFFDGF